MKKLVNLALLNSSGQVIQMMRGAMRVDSIAPVVGYGTGIGSFTTAEYALISSTLNFNLTMTAAPIRIFWEPESAVVWATGASFIDNFTNWHDIIALLAWTHYAAADNSMNPAIQQLLDSRLANLRMFLGNGRDDDASQSVQMIR